MIMLRVCTCEIRMENVVTTVVMRSSCFSMKVTYEQIMITRSTKSSESVTNGTSQPSHLRVRVRARVRVSVRVRVRLRVRARVRVRVRVRVRSEGEGEGEGWAPS